MTVIALGDSTTAGTPAFKSPLEAPPDGAGNVESQYMHWLMKIHPAWRVLNRGVNGERSDQIRARFARDVIAERKDTDGYRLMALALEPVIKGLLAKAHPLL